MVDDARIYKNSRFFSLIDGNLAAGFPVSDVFSSKLSESHSGSSFGQAVS
jgi:hypothetical protein